MVKNNLRIYGSAPYQVAVIHGGPGAPGEMAPVARELSARGGILEPLQTRETLEGQVEELQEVLQEHGDHPITLIGYSWGAMLSYIVTARQPSLVKKLILVSSGVFEEQYASTIMETRLSRLTDEERARFDTLSSALNDPTNPDPDATFAQWGALFSRTDAYDLLPHTDEILECDYSHFQNVWTEAVQLRKSGELVVLGHDIRCPVVAIHGDYDPHPFAGIVTPLSRVIKDFRFTLLPHCGHCPWLEKEARERFYELISEEL